MAEDRIDEILRQLETLRISEAHLLAELQAENRRRNRQSGTSAAPETGTRRIAVGSRVRITNRIKRPANWDGSWTAATIEQSAFATVSRITGERYYIRTDTGINTWRSERNLRLL